MCSEREVKPTENNDCKDISKTGSISFSYAKDIVIASFDQQGKSIDEYMEEIKKRTIEIKNFILENN